MLRNSYTDSNAGLKTFLGSPFPTSSIKRPTQQIRVLRSQGKNSAEKVTFSVKKADKFSFFCLAVLLTSD
jgi:hypothetical protein